MTGETETADTDGDAERRCEHLEYRADERFPTERAFCTVVGEFVQPVRADVCNARYDLAPAEHCEYYREHEGIEDEWLTGDSDAEANEAAGDGSEGS